MTELANVTQRRARKIHYCSDCGKPILPGSEYLSVKGMDCGQFFYEKEHIHCDALINAYCAANDREVFYDRLDEVVEWLRDTACTECLRAGECTRGGQDTFACTTALMKVLPPSLLFAALQSVRESESDAP